MPGRGFAAFLAFVIVAGSVRAQDGGAVIAGRVTDGSARTPIAGARVTLESRSDAPSRTTLTDESGAYALDELPAGVYTLIFESQGHAARAVAGLRIETGMQLRMDAEMTPLPTERVTVRGALDDSGPGLSRTVLDRGSLDSRIAALGDPFRALAGSAGITQANDFKSEMQVRGGEAAETTVRLDGQPLPYAFHFGGGAGSAGTLNGDLLDRLQMETGGYSVEYGNSLAGVVDLSTREATPGRTTGTVGLGSMLAHAALFGPAGAGDWVFSGRFSDLGLYEDRVDGDGVDSVEFQDLYAALRLPLTGDTRLEVGVLEAGNDYEADLGMSNRASMSSQSRGLRARLEVPLDPETLVRVQVADSRLAVDSAVTGGVWFAQEQHRQDFLVSMLRLLSPSHRLNAGLGWERTFGGMRGTVADGVDLRRSVVEDGDDIESVYAEDTWIPASSFTLRYGARADRSGRTGEGALSPRVSFQMRRGNGVLLRGAVGRFVQFPGQEQVFLAAGERLREQVADHFIAGVERSWSSGFRMVVEGYRKILRRPIGEAQNRYVELQELATQYDAGRVQGLEITLVRQGASAWSWQGSYARLSASQTRDGVDSPRNADQKHNLRLSIRRRLGREWEAGAAYRYASGLPYTPLVPWTNGIDYGATTGDLNSARLGAYQRLDLRIERTHAASWGRLGFRLDLLNVLDRANDRAIDLDYDASSGVYYRTTTYQSPFLPVFSLTADF